MQIQTPNHLVGRSESLQDAVLFVADGREDKSLPVRVRIRVAARILLYRWLRTRRIWGSAFRSFRQHIRLQYAKELELGNLGPPFLYDERGNRRENTRTTRRIQCIDTWLSDWPWADSVDLEIFSMGLVAGEQLSGSSDTQFSNISGDLET
jgi:hypothetical protein